jgi:hypothetical protein
LKTKQFSFILKNALAYFDAPLFFQTLLPALSDSCLVDKKRESLLRDADSQRADKTCRRFQS